MTQELAPLWQGGVARVVGMAWLEGLDMLAGWVDWRGLTGAQKFSEGLQQLQQDLVILTSPEIKI